MFLPALVDGVLTATFMKFQRASMFLCGMVLALSLHGYARAQSAPRVAVYEQRGFPYYMVSIATSPAHVVADLRRVGIAAESLDTAALADPARFNIHRYAALVLPYGNTYPASAFANIRAFHQAGGCLILSGVPFTHAVIYDAKRGWVDEGHDSAPALFGPQGMGVGGFKDGPQAPLRLAPQDPLGLGALHRNWEQTAHAQTLDVSTLPPEDHVIPILVEGEEPVAAIIIHHDSAFNGAVDVWTHLPENRDDSAWDTEQMLARGTLVALVEKHLLTPQQMRKAFAVLDRLPPPPIYRDVVLPNPPRPYPTLQPKMPPPAEHLYVAEIGNLPFAQKVLLYSLQGIINRKKPRIYLIAQDSDRFWLQEMQKQNETGTPIMVNDPLSLVSRFRSEINGVVVPDPKVYVSPDIAVNIAAIDNLVVATPQLAKQLHLPIRQDLRGRFKNDADALHYLNRQLLPHLNPYLALCLDPSILDSGAIDYIIAAKGITFWITGPRAQNLPGADMGAELEQVKYLFAHMPLNAVVHGFYWHGEGIGIDEGPGVALASRFGKITTVSDYVANFSVYSGVRLARVQQPHPSAPPPLDRSKVYLSITMSDGDNLCTWRDFFRRYFEDPLHGSIPIGWGMGPTLIDCAPTWVQWYYQHATPNDEFLCDVSGVGYIYPPDWAMALKNRDAAFRSFYDLTWQYMRRMDMHTLRLMGVDADAIAKVASYLPQVSFIMADYGYQGERSYDQLTYRLPSGQEVFRAVTSGGSGETLANEIRQRIGNVRPAFINVFVMNWSTKLEDLRDMLKILGPDYVAVTPSQLAALYRESITTTTSAR
ncbi:GxGYxY sequence motif in domain of unknown function [Chthonomonas calidirosea]|uniref:GxGYxYP domain-containing protein n=1 Tax=Chthonomonas calidirosea TaxID=454171 RepID=UPI0006DD45F8|nr:GxGYxYP domain-containing protein [Chthonomonas calidirosea]CEK15748.1 GxGYxY sequence motif in domain of unknown function [Chthonomonas calidirosea]